MPWKVVHRKKKWFVKDDAGKLTPAQGYDTQGEAEAYKKALYANAGPEAQREVACRFEPVRGLASPSEIQGYLALWGSPEVRDCYDTYFDRERPPMMDLKFLPIPLRYAHGQDAEIGKAAIGQIDQVWVDDRGVAFHGILDQGGSAYPRIAREVSQGILATSSGTTDYLAEFADDGRFVSWPVSEVSLTDKPCEFRMPSVVAIRNHAGGYEMRMQADATPSAVDDPGDCGCEAEEPPAQTEPNRELLIEETMAPKPTRAEPGVEAEKPTPPAAPEKNRVGLTLSMLGLDANASIQEIYEKMVEMLGPAGAKAVLAAMTGGAEAPKPDAEMLPADIGEPRYEPDTRPLETAGTDPEDIGAPRSDSDLVATLRALLGNQVQRPTPAKRTDEVAALRQQVAELQRALLVDDTQAAPRSARFNRTAPIARDVRDLRYDGQKPEDLAYACRILEAVGKEPSDALLRATSYGIARSMEQGTPVGTDMTVQYLTPFRSTADVMSTDLDYLRRHARSNEVMGDTNTGYGSNYVGVYYDTSLWLKVRAMPIWRQLEARGMEEKVIPVGYASDVIPLEGADFTWYRVPETVDVDATGRPKINITPGVAGTSSTTLTVRTLGALVYYSVLLEEDSIVPMAAELNRKANIQTQERIEYVIFNGDTATGSGNLNYKNGSVGASDVYAFTTASGMLRAAIIGNSGLNARAASGLSDLDYQKLFALIGNTNNAITGSDPDKLLFVVDPSTALATNRLPIVKTANVNSAATIEKGNVTEMYAVPIVRSGQIALADTTGYIDAVTPGNNAYGRILLVRPDQWVIGFKRQVTMEYFRDVPGQSNGMVITLRLGLQLRDAAQAAACTYKVVVA